MPRSMKYSSLLLIAAWSLACSRSGEPNNASGMASKATAAGDLAPSDTTPPKNLAGTRWRLMEIQSPKNPKAAARPEDPRKYWMSFDSEGGIVVVQLDCHRARGNYADKRNPDRRGGTLTISSLAPTGAQCAQPLGNRVMNDLGSVRAYRVASGQLFLDGLPDGSTYVWQRTEVPQ
jgi:hypothetical protein